MTHFFEPVADHLGAAYLRYSFTKGTEQEVGFLVDALGLAPGNRILDVGCGPGRHALALATRGMEVVGIDISERFIALAHERAHAAAGLAAPGLAGTGLETTGLAATGLAATFVRGDARTMAYDSEFDAAICLCQGAFGLVPGEDAEVLRRLVRALKPGGVAAVTAFSAYFQVRWLTDADTFDVDAGVNHERAVVRDEEGVEGEYDLWTSVFTPRELRMLARDAGAAVEGLWSVTPGEYRRQPPDLDHPEFLLLLRRS